MTHGLWVLLTLFWPWLLAALCMAEAVRVAEAAPGRGPDEDGEPARGVLLALLVTAAIFLVVFGGWWLTWRT